MITKKLFVDSINSIIEADDYQSALNNFFKDNDVDGYIFQPDCSVAVVNLLHGIFGEADNSEIISYFCFEIDFGRKWKPGCFVDNGKDIDISSAEKLYDYLVSIS